MHYNLRPHEPRQAFPALIATPCQVWTRWTYPLPYYSVLLLIHYFTLWPLPLTFALEHLQHIACDVIKLCAKFECNRVIRGGVIAISVFDLMTLNIALRVALGSGIIFTKSDLRQLIRAWIIAFFSCWYVMTRCDVDLWPVDLESLWYIRRHVIKVCLKFEQNRAISGWIIDNFANFAHVMSRCEMAFDLLAMNFYSTSAVMRLNSVQNLSEIE